MNNATVVEVTADIVSAHVSNNNNVDVGQVGDLVQRVHSALARLGAVEEEPQAKVPVVSVRASIKPDRLICMECGREAKMLKRHLQTAHGMSPAEYAGRRSDLAKPHGFGRKAGVKPARKGKGSAIKAKAQPLHRQVLRNPNYRPSSCRQRWSEGASFRHPGGGPLSPSKRVLDGRS